jgi:transcriptional regulator with XRE-family HTH domain
MRRGESIAYGRELRTAAVITQTALAKQSGVNRSYASNLVQGRRNPTVLTLRRLARSLRVSPASFFDELPESSIDL